jgi:formamidopyrimidine-DNA glycosylase
MKEKRMPELPEVETTIRGLQPHLEQAIIQEVIIRQHQLRWLIPKDLNQQLTQQQIIRITRRGKYLLFQCTGGTLIIHLGMSGRLRLLSQPSAPKKHDHVDILFKDNCLRYTDPRRFGAILWTSDDPMQHVLLKKLGVEPLTAAFTADYLYQHTRKRHTAIKALLMNHQVVVGIGNIYAAEALFLARIHPAMPAHQLTLEQAHLLVKQCKLILTKAITRGGTTLKDFSNSEGKPGYFSQQLHVYGREGLPCSSCQETLQSIVLAQRNSVFCPRCQR